jgi:molybdopterin/thiamine biosynthesis adenylyltransferase
MTPTPTPLTPTPLAGSQDDRHARSRLVPGWDADRLARSTAIVAGVGALGNEVAKNLALAGVGRLVLCDPDRVAVPHLGRTVLFEPADVGRPKPLAAAAALARLAPDTEVVPRLAELVSGVGLGELAGAGVVLGCLDTVRARMQLLGRAALVEAPLVDGGTGPWAGEVRVRLTTTEPCFACTLTEHERGRSDVPWSCAEPPPTGPAAASIVTTALVASWMTVAAIRVLLGDPPPQRLLRIDARSGRTEPATIARDPACPHHRTLPGPVSPVPVGAGDTVGALLAALPAGAEPIAWTNFAMPLRCAVCGNYDPLQVVGSCSRCGSVLRARSSERLRDAGAERRLADLGVAPEEILTVHLPGGKRQWRQLS